MTNEQDIATYAIITLSHTLENKNLVPFFFFLIWMPYIVERSKPNKFVFILNHLGKSEVKITTSNEIELPIAGVYSSINLIKN